VSKIKVSSVSQLDRALSIAKGGDVIVLASGTYDGLQIEGLNFKNPITITSEDEYRKAELMNVDVANSSGIQFSDVSLVATAKSPLGTLTIKSSSNISVYRSYIHGSEDGDPSNDSDGIRVVDSKNVNILNSDFNQLRIGIGHADSRGLTVTGNNIHDIRMDGIRGSGSSDVTISKNYIYDFYRIDGDHADAVQFYTSSKNPVSSNISVYDNLIDQGNGLAAQGIFMRNAGDGLFKNVAIKDNIIIGGNHNGIYVEGGDQVSLTNNEIYSVGQVISWIRLIDARGVELFDNQARKIIAVDLAGVASGGNVLNEQYTGDRDSLIAAWKRSISFDADADAGAEERPAPSEPSIVPGGVIGINEDIQLGSDAYGAKLTGGGDWQALGNGYDNALYGNGGNNVLRGFAGADLLDGRDGDDMLDGGAGVDVASYAQASHAVAVDLSIAGPQNTLGAGVDHLLSIEGLEGSRNADTLSGSSLANELRGAAGDDILFGGGGADLLVGGGGSDRFVYRSVGDSPGGTGGADAILDFRPMKGDVIDLSLIDARQGGRDDSFVLVDAFSQRAGQIAIERLEDHYAVMGDVNGDGRADIVIEVYSSHPLTSDSFVL